ncbi:hypothetical protein DSO57_1025793 [Entomophthora muscae]|uniref:Uncharacterized protein n=1 Tax=Entomophthora muscae TaxID=34485 RepID=A0ACC2U0N6_9FUNG|nr:hypothetical protein DSO57_1025793 [Entomophthora muscae]
MPLLTQHVFAQSPASSPKDICNVERGENNYIVALKDKVDGEENAFNLDEAFYSTLESEGGKIKSRFTLIPGFSVQLPESLCQKFTQEGNKYYKNFDIELDGAIHIQK